MTVKVKLYPAFKMANQIARLFTLTKFSRINQITNSHILGCYSSKRYVQEFPEMRMNNAQPKDYLLVLPEPLNETPNTNELLRLPKQGEPELDYTKMDTEMMFKGLSHLVCSFENYLTDFNNQETISDKPIKEFFKDIEKNLYPLDSAFNVLLLLLNVQPDKYDHKELYLLISRYYTAREARLSGNFKDTIQNYMLTQYDKLPEVDKKMLKIYFEPNPSRATLRTVDENTMSAYKKHLKTYCSLFRENLAGANQLFSHTVDDPDILSVVSPEFDDCQDLHHKERTPLKITATTYQKFMQVCPDRFVRQMLWQTRNKRCSPKALPKYNNISVISNLRILRRKIADVQGYRTHVDCRLSDAMANSRQQIISNLKHLNEENTSTLNDRLYELNEYAIDNQFEDTNQAGIQEYDVDYWTNRYKYEILIGKSEPELKSFFPLNTVTKGIENYFKNYFGIDIKKRSSPNTKLWDENVELLEVSRNNEPLGTILLDPYQSANKKLLEPFYARVRGRSHLFECLPTRLISTSYKPNQESKQTYLTVHDMMNLFLSYATVIQRFMYKYEYYELNTYGAMEVDTKNLLPHLCIAHLLTDHRILQSFSDRGGSKPIDTEFACRILKATNYFKSFKTWRELYLAHLDIEVHSSLSDIKGLVEEIYSQYSPFSKQPDDYEYCSLQEIFVGPNDGVQYADLWSKQLANLCLSEMLSQVSSTELSSTDFAKIKTFNSKLLDTLFDPDNFNTQEKLLSLLGRNFEPSKSSLGVL